MKREVMELWRVCFDDTEEFIQFYFDKKYKEENALVYWDEQGAAIAALQTLLYPMTFGVTQIVTGYISGACTHPLARARGVMTKLLREAFYVMRGRKIPVSTLIPARWGTYLFLMIPWNITRFWISRLRIIFGWKLFGRWGC